MNTNELCWLAEIVASWIEVYFSCSLVMKRFRIDKTERKNWSCFLASAMAVLVFLFNKFALFSAFQTITIMALEVWAVYRYVEQMLWKIIFYVSFAMLLVGISDGLTILAINGAMGYPSSEWLTQVGGTRLLAIIISKMLFLVFMITAEFFIKESPLVKKRYIMLGGVLEILLILSLFVLEKNVSANGETKQAMVMFFGIILVFLLGNILLRHLLEKQEHTMKFRFLELRNEMLEQSLRDTEEVYGFWRKAVHDYKHKMLVINEYVEENRIDELRKFLSEEQKYINREMFYQKTGNPVVDTVLNVKKQQAVEAGITFTFSAYLPEKMSIKDIHLASLLGNVVDNAIQAKSNIENPWVEVKMKVKNNVLLIKVDNGYVGEPINFEKTRKEELYVHGIGLQSVQDILREYDGNFQINQLEDKVRCVISVPIEESGL